MPYWVPLKMTEVSMSSKGFQRKHIVIIMHSVLNLKFFWVPIIEAMTKEFSVTLYIRNDAPEILSKISLDCRIVIMPIERKISPVSDFLATVKIFRQLRRDGPDLLQTITPKAGLLGMLAGSVARVPIRIHTFQGQVWANSTGLKRWFFRFIDVLIAKLSTNLLAVSRTEIDFLRRERVLRHDQGQVLGSGSISGVDLSKFDHRLPADVQLKSELGLTGDEFVFLYLGRLQRDKGLDVLADAYSALLSKTSRPIRLVVVGPDEDNLGQALKAKLGSAVVVRPYTDRPDAYHRLAHVTVLPSFREGFGSVLIEAAALGVPTIASRIYGIDCAVVDGETGLLFEPGDARALESCMNRLLNDSSLHKKLSSAGMSRAVHEFDQKVVVARLVAYYGDALVEQKGRA
jgi:glycosyltransferase involved in cell wall biosynthesis